MHICIRPKVRHLDLNYAHVRVVQKRECAVPTIQHTYIQYLSIEHVRT